jgi:diguanylate cyclase (GGDEF)-like protein
MTASFGKNHLTGRIGGDEFAVCMYFKNDDPSADIRESARKEFEQFHRNFKKTFENNPAIDISAGLIIADSSEKTFDEIYKRADELLYRSKSMGKGMISYD